MPEGYCGEEELKDAAKEGKAPDSVLRRKACFESELSNGASVRKTKGATASRDVSSGQKSEAKKSQRFVSMNWALSSFALLFFLARDLPHRPLWRAAQARCQRLGSELPHFSC